MKSTFFFALALCGALFVTACQNAANSTGGGDSITYSGTTSAGTYTLTITESNGRAAYEPKSGDSYVLSITARDGKTNTSRGTVASVTPQGAVSLKPANGQGFTVRVNSAGGITNITGTITLEGGGTTAGPGAVTPSAGGTGNSGGGGSGAGGGNSGDNSGQNPELPPVIALTLTPPRPLSGAPLTAGFTVNGAPVAAAYSWSRSSGDGNWNLLPDETGPELLPWTEDVGCFLRVTAAYDGAEYHAESGMVDDSLAALIGSGAINVDLMPGAVTDGSDLSIALPAAAGVSYEAAVDNGNSQTVQATFSLSTLAGSLTRDASYTVSIKVFKDYGPDNKGGQPLAIAAPYTCVVIPRQAFSTFSGKGISGGSITEPYGNPQYRGGNSITVADNAYAVTAEQYERLAGWCKNNAPEVRSLYSLRITNGVFENNVTLTGGPVSSISLYGFNAGAQTFFTPENLTVTSYLGVEDGAVLVLPDVSGGGLNFNGATVHIRVAPGGCLGNQAVTALPSASPWTAGLEQVRWTFRHSSTVYTQGYPSARAFITNDNSGIDSTAVWETNSASNESSLEISPPGGSTRALVRIDGKTTFIHAFIAYSDWDIKEGSKITVVMRNPTEVFDFSNGVSPDETNETETAKRWRLIGHIGPLPIANSYFRVDQGHLISLPGIESKIWTSATSFRWSNGKWVAETQTL